MADKKITAYAPLMKFLKKLRDSRGLTKYSMAKLLGMIPNTYNHYEDKAEGIKLDTLAHIRTTLGLTWDELGKMIDVEVLANRKKKGD